MDMKTLRQFLLLSLAILLVACSLRQDSGLAQKTEGWQVSAPEAQGMDEQVLQQIAEEIEQTGVKINSFLVVRHGSIVFEYYRDGMDQDTQHNLYSCTKSISSTLIGIAIDQGKLQGVDQAVLELFPERTFANPDPQKTAMTLEDFLTMTSGLDWDEGDPLIFDLARSPDWVQKVLDLPMATVPGGTYNYCSGCSHILSAIVEQTTGMRTLDFAKRYLFDPLGIQDYTWDVDAQGTAVGGWGIHMTTRDMAKIGLLFLHEGAWDGQQVVSAAWVENATRAHIEQPELDYGYQWWIYPSRGAYLAMGRGGQTIFVDPEDDLVIAATADLRNHTQVFNLIEDFVFPAVIH